MSNLKEYFDNTVSRDFLELMCSHELGSGAARQVRRLSINPEYVVKFETDACSFQNVLEYNVWDRVKETKFAKWFAPCQHISPCGTVLIQKFARDLERGEYPSEIPAFFTDLKEANWGMYDGHPVCRDYGVNLLIEKGLTSKLRKAEFWD